MPLGNRFSKTVESFAPVIYPDRGPISKENPHYSFGYTIETNYDNKKPGVGSYELKTQSNGFNKYFESYTGLKVVLALEKDPSHTEKKGSTQVQQNTTL